MQVVITNMCLDGNRGDLAILAGTVASLRDADPTAVVTISPMEVGRPEVVARRQPDTAELSDMPLLGSPVPNRRDDGLRSSEWAMRMARAIASERLGLPAVEGPEDRSFREALEAADLVVVKGGSWLFSYPTVAQAIFTCRMLHPMRVAQRAGIPCVILGTSLGPWQAFSRRSYVKTLGRCDRVVVRERLSYDFAVRMGLQNVELGVDMAFALYRGRPAFKKRDGIAITPRQLPFEPPDVLERYERAVEETVRMLVDERGEHCYLATQVDEDLALCQRLAERIDRPGSVTVADEISSLPLEELMQWYGQRRLVIGARIHSVILAGLMHTPSVILECDPPKMVGISEQMGLDRWRVQAGGPEVTQLPELVREALDVVEDTEAGFSEPLSKLAETAREQTASALRRVGAPMQESVTLS